MLNDLLLIEVLLITILFYLYWNVNVLILWYLGGLYLILLGLLLLWADGDIFVGFLWVIDLGVGLIFLIFILHFFSFLNSKTYLLINFKLTLHVFISFLFITATLWILSTPSTSNDNLFVYFLTISWYDYYDFLVNTTITDLNLMRELYFFNNSWEFVIINFLLLYGIVLSIFLTFLIKKFQVSLISDQLISKPFLKQQNSIFFIRNQNIITQQNTSTGSRVWKRNAAPRI